MKPICVVKTGVNLATGSASTNTAIPTNSSGKSPVFIRLSCTQACYVKLGPSGVTATAGDLLLYPAESIIVNTCGLGYIAGKQVATAGILQISPLENS